MWLLKAKMRESIMEDQDELLIRKLEYEEVDLETDNKAVLTRSIKLILICQMMKL